MSGTTSDENDLFEEMNALVRRYGVQKCQEALNAAASVEDGITKGNVHPKIYDILDFVISDMTEWNHFQLYDDFINLNFREDSEPKKAWLILDVLELYHDSLSHFSPDDRYRFHALSLGTSPEIVEQVLAASNVIKLFERVVVQGGDFWDCPIPENSMIQVKDLVVDGGSITSLTVQNSPLGHEDIIQFAGMLEVNHLISLEVLQTIECTDNVDRCVVTKTLTESLQVHVQTFAGASKLQVLDLGRLVDCRDSGVQQELFNVIAMLPSLDSLSITVEDPSLLESLIGGISQWMIPTVKVCCSYDITTTNLLPLFDAIAESRFIRVFDFGYCPDYFTIRYQRNPRFSMDVCAQILDFALSPSVDRLLQFSTYGIIEMAHFDSLIPEAFDRTIAIRRQLRRFNLMGIRWNNMRSILGENWNHMVLPTLQSLLHLVSKHLPYVHDVGIQEWNYYERCFYDDDIEGIYIPGSLELMNQLLAQLDDNRVGMTLFEPEVFATVPAGLWPKVLHHAIAFRQRVDDDVPWTSVFKMVHKLVEVGGIGWSEGYAVTPSLPAS